MNSVISIGFMLSITIVSDSEEDINRAKERMALPIFTKNVCRRPITKRKQSVYHNRSRPAESKFFPKERKTDGPFEFVLPAHPSLSTGSVHGPKCIHLYYVHFLSEITLGYECPFGAKCQARPVKVTDPERSE
jgi:hypothetical protein